MQRRVMNNCKPEGTSSQLEGKILLVDDDLQDLQYHFMILQQQGYQVVTCGSYAAALRLLACDDFDFVVASQGGPSFEGRRVLECAMALDRPIPVLILAKCVDMRAYLDAMWLGAVDYLQKTVDPSEMMRLIKGHLRPPEQPQQMALPCRRL